MYYMIIIYRKNILNGIDNILEYNFLKMERD